ncbi:MAG TPA: hypothetical protein VGB53_00770 [Rubricoccaceae bacterium]|jgi:hypothetical protein
MSTYETVRIGDVLRTTVHGDLDLDGSARILHGVAAENASRGLHLLVDLRDADGAPLSFADVYQLSGLLAETPVAFRSRIALLDTFREGFEKVQFFEASATHRGFVVHSFLDEGAAAAWLAAGGPVGRAPGTVHGSERPASGSPASPPDPDAR